MDAVKIEALRLAASRGGSAEMIVVQAANFERYLRGDASGAAPGSDAKNATDNAEKSISNASLTHPGEDWGIADLVANKVRAAGIGGLDAGVSAGSQVRHSRSTMERRHEMEEGEARCLLIQQAFRHKRVNVATFMCAGMPEWLARAALEEMHKDTEGGGFLDKDNRFKDWLHFAERFLRTRNDIRAPSLELRTVPQF